MSAESAPLRMIKLSLDARRLMETARRVHLPLRDLDDGYLMHCQLWGLFGENPPQPFSARQGKGSSIEVLAYTDRSEEDLRRHAATFADPEYSAACDWNRFAAKQMPLDWAAGQRLGFEVRACPVVRMSSAGPKWRKGAELDAFLARCLKLETAQPATSEVTEKIPVDREETYREWLEKEVARGGGARLVRAGVVAFKLEKLTRRTHGAERHSKRVPRPDVQLEGELEVVEPKAFDALLRRGIGRHRSFGYGMLLLRRASR